MGARSAGEVRPTFPAHMQTHVTSEALLQTTAAINEPIHAMN